MNSLFARQPSFIFASLVAMLVLVSTAFGQVVTARAMSRLTADFPAGLVVKFGDALDVDGDWMVAGGSNGGVGFVFNRTGTTWTQFQALLPGTADIAVDGNIIASTYLGDSDDITQPNVNIFVFDGSSWVLEETLPNSPLPNVIPFSSFGLGKSVDVSGDTVVIGYDGKAIIYLRSGNVWADQQVLIGGSSGYSDSLDLDGDTLVVGQPDQNLVHVYDRTGTAWNLTETLDPNGPGGTPLASLDTSFGTSVALDGDWLAVGDPTNDEQFTNGGKVYLFERIAGNWTGPQAELFGMDLAAGDAMGSSVSLDCNPDFVDRLLVGATGDDNVAFSEGSAYLFERASLSSPWIQAVKLTGISPAQNDLMGASTALATGAAFIGAPRIDVGANNQGAIYFQPISRPSVFSGTETHFCFGDGGDQAGCADCPCGVNSPPGSMVGCPNSTFQGAQLDVAGIPSEAADTLRFDLTGSTPATFAMLASGDARLPSNGICPPGVGIPAGSLDGLRCIGTNIIRHGVRSTGPASTSSWGAPDQSLISQAGFNAGQTRHFQVFYRDNGDVLCGTGQNTSNGVTQTIQP